MVVRKKEGRGPVKGDPRRKEREGNGGGERRARGARMNKCEESWQYTSTTGRERWEGERPSAQRERETETKRARERESERFNILTV